MDAEAVLKIAKASLNLLNDHQDAFLRSLISSIQEELRIQGIVLTDSVADVEMVAESVAIRFRMRAETDQDMPRYLKFLRNNRLFSQKSKEGGGGNADG
ncbi:MAG TPA: hypothetical protein IAC31_09185 [Candidatus Faecousia intestinigallinarum]|nr:hypothetical protein [Candidatus Faecousia intestinigallinarum]